MATTPITKLGELSNNDYYRIKAECGNDALAVIESIMEKIDELVDAVNDLAPEEDGGEEA